MNEIFPGLWIGSCPFKENAPNLLRFGIKSILTLDALPLSDGVFDCFNRKFIRLLDEPSQDVLDILEEALDFIDLSLTTGGILVHCAMGVSRSATIVIAYVMRKNKLSYDSALEIVMKKRLVYPNIGFVNQLKLFEVMKWKVDRKSPVYTQYASIRTFRGSNIAYNRTDSSTTIATRDPVQPATFKCRKCRRALFSSANLVSHCLPDSTTPSSESVDVDGEDNVEISTVLIKGITLNAVPTPCTRDELFTDPLEWTRPYTHEVEGKLYCPGCQAKVGSFNWCGERCVCGTWVTPAFHFNRNHLDRIDRRLASSQSTTQPLFSAPNKVEPTSTSSSPSVAIK
ncbi:dual specificity phosphatase, catalytic domain protein [Opisthorchis viverrini]|nr:dual specificity phosphatase, catalytic domain protein [Opisthorchis viverrini]